MQNPYSQADSIIRHNETVVAILLVDNSDTKRTQHEDEKDKGRKSSDQVLVLVSIVILLVDRKKGGAREHENRF
ncbi:hypothetical protein ACS0PU_000348 [Formica fusca]